VILVSLGGALLAAFILMGEIVVKHVKKYFLEDDTK